MARRSDIALSQGMICDAALEIVEADGLDALTMRSLARKLEVQAPSLYAHYRDKSELISDLATSYFVEARDAVYEWASARDWLTKFGLALYNVLKTRRDAAQLFARAQPPVRSDGFSAETAAAPLTAAGYSVETAVEMQAAVIALAMGMAIDHSHHGTSAYLKQFFDLDNAFRAALSALTGGLVDLAMEGVSTK